MSWQPIGSQTSTCPYLLTHCRKSITMATKWYPDFYLSLPSHAPQTNCYHGNQLVIRLLPVPTFSHTADKVLPWQPSGIQTSTYPYLLTHHRQTVTMATNWYPDFYLFIPSHTLQTKCYHGNQVVSRLLPVPTFSHTADKLLPWQPSGIQTSTCPYFLTHCRQTVTMATNWYPDFYLSLLSHTLQTNCYHGNQLVSRLLPVPTFSHTAEKLLPWQPIGNQTSTCPYLLTYCRQTVTMATKWYPDFYLSLLSHTLQTKCYRGNQPVTRFLPVPTFSHTADNVLPWQPIGNQASTCPYLLTHHRQSVTMATNW